MDKRRETVAARLRQLYAADRNALDIYGDLAGKCDVPELRERLIAIARDEAKHMRIDKELLDLLNPTNPSQEEP